MNVAQRLDERLESYQARIDQESAGRPPTRLSLEKKKTEEAP